MRGAAAGAPGVPYRHSLCNSTDPCPALPPSEWLPQLPAGLVDVNETAGEAAVRELKEETGEASCC